MAIHLKYNYMLKKDTMYLTIFYYYRLDCFYMYRKIKNQQHRAKKHKKYVQNNNIQDLNC